jgi:hypothetical protein
MDCFFSKWQQKCSKRFLNCHNFAKLNWILESFYFHFSKAKFDLVVTLCMYDDHILCYITKLRKINKNTHTHTHKFTSFAFSKWHNTWPHLWDHGIPQHESINQPHTPSFSFSNLKRNGWKFHVNGWNFYVNGWNLTYMKKREEGILKLSNNLNHLQLGSNNHPK